MNVEITKEINSPECIRCGKCIEICHCNAIQREKVCKCQNTKEAVVIENK